MSMGSDKAAMRAMKSNQIRMQSSSKQHKFKKQLRELNEASFGRIMQLGVLKCNKVDNILILCNPLVGSSISPLERNTNNVKPDSIDKHLIGISQWVSNYLNTRSLQS